MLNRIFIQNFALIDSLELHLQKGLQVITGETGAGKSIILGALRLILGERADSKVLQNSEQKSVVEAEFTLNGSLRPYFEENDLDFEQQTIIRREILTSGKSRAFVNDVPVTLEILKELSQQLIDIHSQFETSDLFREEYQFRIIDGLSANKKIITDYQAAYQAVRKTEQELEKVRKKLQEGNREADYRLYLLNELQEAALDEVDLEDLQSQLSMQENAESISENLAQVLSRFDQDEIGVLDSLAEIRTKLGRTAELSHHFSEISERFESQFLELKDLVFEVQNEAEKIEVNPKILAELNEKVNRIQTLFVKHNAATVPELISIRDEIAGEQNSLAEVETSIHEKEKILEAAYSKLSELAGKLSDNRKKAAPEFKKKTEKLLKQLGLEKATIEVELAKNKEYSSFGKDRIGILFQANAGFPLKPIQNAISGGERSRVMLAVKKIMAENSDLPTLILDEIDTGVSGKVAEEMGNVMREMSQDMQLIVITHLAQVAAKGDANYKVLKEDISGRTQSRIIPLQTAEKLQEIAQLLSGSRITEAALKQAGELMK